ncbi:phage antirepressor KilAC domain-containing protein [Marisediminicola senii]|uniref:phage antirepressor KilAC domain-containing protein n=1 Tax=Marisediminicola senii TaxID=2711233 RepID=UPI0013EA8FE9|nr:phage antirepressor KilAC domain-containing protein [Marisediminicola senii]
MPTSDIAILPYRWATHRVDVCMTIRAGQIAFIARDVLEAIGVTPMGEIAADPKHTGTPLHEHARAIAWNRQHLADVLAPVNNSTDPIYAAFLQWIDGLIHQVHVIGIEKVTASATRVVADLTPTVARPAAPTWYSVEDAARILSTDPSLQRLTRTGLFATLEQRGWIYRDGDTWLPHNDILLAGLLVVTDVRIPASQQLYPQICITPHGVEKLHTWLGGTGAMTLPISITEARS